jgi:hypothetical protein
MEPRVASTLASFSGSVSAVPGCPGSSPLQRRLRLSLRVAPSSSIFRLAYGESLQVAPNPLSFRPGLEFSLRGAPAAVALSLPWDQSPGFPEGLLPWPRQRMDLRVAPNSAPSGAAVSASSGRPDCCVYGCAAPRLRVAPNPASAAGPMLTPRLNSNFASSTEGRG